MLRVVFVAFLMICTTFTAFAQKKPKVNYQIKPGEISQAEEVAKNFVAAAQPCDNYAWGAGVEMMMMQKQVRIPQRDWVMKAFGGYKCVTSLTASDYGDLVRYITGDYALTPDRKVRIEAEFAPGAPITPDPFIASFRAGEPLMLIWKGKAYVWYGAVYDEYIHPTGNRKFELRELKLLDPLAKTKETQTLSFVKGKDDANEIDGVMRITVSPR